MNYREELNQAYDWAEKYLNKGGQWQLTKQLNIRFVKLSKSVARVFPSHCVLEIDSHFWSKESAEEKEATIAHEIAHIVVFRMFGRVKSHGPEFRSMMLAFGYKVIGADCHSSKHIAARKKIHDT